MKAKEMQINFTKAVASGNDFIITGASRLNYKKLAKKFCERKFGIGADGFLVVEPSQKADFRMRIFNPDGSEAEMCGNGIRCAALYVVDHRPQTTDHRHKRVNIETKAGIVETKIKNQKSKIKNCNPQKIKVKMPQPKNLKLDIPLKIDNKTISVNFVNVGVPHTVIFAKNLEKVDVQNLGRKIREHQKFKPKGTNVNFVEVLTEDSIRIRTYERGVEGETFSCGTGSVASTLMANGKWQMANGKINVHTQGEILKVYFDEQLKDIYLEGEARIVYEGTYAL